MTGAHGSGRKVAGSGTTGRLGEPVISASPIPPPRVKDANTRAPAESSVVVATPMLWPEVNAERKAGTVQVPPGDSHVANLVCVKPAPDLVGELLLLVAPEAVPFDERY